VHQAAGWRAAFIGDDLLHVGAASQLSRRVLESGDEYRADLHARIVQRAEQDLIGR